VNASLAAAAWLLVAFAAWWIGALGAGARRELLLLDEGGSTLLDAGGEDDYRVLSLLRRLEDDPIALAMRCRLSRYLAGAFVPLGLAAAAAPLPGAWIGVAVFAGWLSSAAAEASGGGVLPRRMGRARAGIGYTWWARITGLPARLTARLLRIRLPHETGEAARVLVRAESQAVLAATGSGLGREERRFLRRLLASTGILVADIQVPWSRVVRVDAAATLDEAEAVVRDSGRSRLPVVDGVRVAGVLNAKDLLVRNQDPASGSAPVRGLLRPAYFVRQEETVRALLDELQTARSHLAVVVDRLGRSVGIVTMEDVLEEIVGELYDEREREEERR
jgi:CBS domain-containing protein